MRQIRNLKQQSDEELMRLLERGDKEAFSEIYERYHTRMLNYFFRMMYRDEEKARDFTHDLFVKIIEKPNLFNSDKKFSTWIYAVASNMCKNEYRSMAVRDKGADRISQLTERFESETTPHQLDLEKFKLRLKDEMDELNPQQKEAFVMRFQEEIPIKEIAQVMECSEGTVKSRLFYSLKKMSEKLKEFNPNR